MYLHSLRGNFRFDRRLQGPVLEGLEKVQEIISGDPDSIPDDVKERVKQCFSLVRNGRYPRYALGVLASIFEDPEITKMILLDESLFVSEADEEEGDEEDEIVAILDRRKFACWV